MKHGLTLTILFIFASLCFSQTTQKAEQLFNNGQYEEAGNIYLKLVKSSPQNPLYNYRYARCLYELRRNEEAVSYFLKCGKKYPLTQFYIAEAYFREYGFSDALPHYETYIQSIDSTKSNWELTQRRIEQCRTGSRLLRHVQQISITDTFLVAKAAFLDFYRLSSDAGHLAIDTDNLVTYTTSRNNRRITARRNPVSGRTELYSSENIMDGWTQAVPFYSDKANNINFPYLLSDGVTLYFASDNPSGMGGWDIYNTRYSPSSESFLKADNIGFPFNSPYNDYMLAIDEILMKGWFATDRYCPDDSVKIVAFVWSEDKQYMSTDDDKAVRDFARLRNITLDKSQESDMTLIPATSPEHYSGSGAVSSQFEFAISEDIIYTQYSDFKNPNARDMYREYRRSYEQYEQEMAELDRLRLLYAKAGDDAKQALAARIEQLEAATTHRNNALRQRENQIRQLEQIPL